MSSINSFEELDAFTEDFKNIAVNQDSTAERLIIGLDFGTTYSGVAYAFTTKPDQIYTINEWPGAKGRTAPKVPTLIKYDDPDNFRWGYELDRTTKERIEGIKLLLDPDQPKPLYVPAVNTEAQLKRLGKPAIEVATDYIGALYRYAMQKIEAKYPKSYLDMLDRRFVLSVPAVWSDKAKDATLRAARHAGIDPITLIKEPEAAALFTLHSMENRGLEVGDALVLCDAGGGTVDLISYEIMKLNPLEVKELVHGTGGLAGSQMLNLRFEQWVKDIVGEKAFLDLRETDSFRLAMKTFDENIKPGFRSRDDEDQYVNFPKANLTDDPNKGLKANCITVTGETLHNIFQPVFKDIDRLVGEQVKEVYIKRMKERHPKGFEIKAIFLVGGFGSSAYLCESIKAAHMDVQVIQPNDAWSAIVRGAVMSQLPQEASVTSNVAPKHYGVAIGFEYDPTRDGNEKQWHLAYEDIPRVSVMNWHITKDDDLLRSRKVEFRCYRCFSVNPTWEELQIETNLLESDQANAPVHPKAGLTNTNCVLKTDLSRVPKEAFKRRIQARTGAEYSELHYKLAVSIQSGPMTFSLEVAGKEYGQVNASY